MHQIGVDIDGGGVYHRCMQYRFRLSLSIPLSPLGSGTPQQGRVPTPQVSIQLPPHTPLDEPHYLAATPSGCALLLAVNSALVPGQQVLCASR